jgi:hypothetical protein
VVRHHPAIGQINVVLELDSDHLRVNLDDCAHQPIAHPVAIAIVIAKDFDLVANIVGIILIWGRCEEKVWQSVLLIDVRFD